MHLAQYFMTVESGAPVSTFNLSIHQAATLCHVARIWSSASLEIFSHHFHLFARLYTGNI
jgi:hypothetical protein